MLSYTLCRWEVPVGRPSIARPKPERSTKGSSTAVAAAAATGSAANNNSTQQQEQTTPPKPIVVDGVTVAQVEIQVCTAMLILLLLPLLALCSTNCRLRYRVLLHSCARCGTVE
jgi:hypothetical protein